MAAGYLRGNFELASNYSLQNATRWVNAHFVGPSPLESEINATA